VIPTSEEGAVSSMRLNRAFFCGAHESPMRNQLATAS
jgi:hypothetical protein